MDEEQKAQWALIEQAVKSFADEGKDLADQWDAIDRKAQGMVTVAGVFVAGLLAFVKDLAEDASGGQRYALTVSLGLLVVAVAFSLFAMHMRSAKPAPVGDTLKTMVDELLGAGTPDYDAFRKFANDHGSAWAAANEDVLKVNLKKAYWLEASQWLLVGGVFAAAAATLMRTWGG